MSPAERIRSALSRYEQQGFSSVKLDTLAGRVGVTEDAVLAEAGRAGMTVQSRGGAAWVLLRPPQRNLRATEAARQLLEDHENALEFVGTKR